MNSIVLLILAMACIASCVASKNPGLEALKSFKPRLEDPVTKGAKTLKGGCGLLECANACFKDENCRAFQLKILDGEDMKTDCVLIITTERCIAPINKDNKQPKELIWLRKGSGIPSDEQVTGYARKTALSCIAAGYKTSLKGVCGSPDCATECNKHNDCRGFRMTMDGCEIFRFTVCSKNLVEHKCKTREPIHIRNIPGLEKGRLCPSGYVEKHGVSTYKIFSVSTYEAGAEKCRKEKGLVKYADADDREEDLHMHRLKHKINNDRFFFIGGKLTNRKTYEWETCGHEVHRNLWSAGQPSSKKCCVVVSGSLLHGLDDAFHDLADFAMCECVNPFD